jgi:hypothetical protein
LSLRDKKISPKKTKISKKYARMMKFHKMLLWGGSQKRGWCMDPTRPPQVPRPQDPLPLALLQSSPPPTWGEIIGGPYLPPNLGGGQGTWDRHLGNSPPDPRGSHWLLALQEEGSGFHPTPPFPRLALPHLWAGLPKF